MKFDLGDKVINKETGAVCTVVKINISSYTFRRKDGTIEHGLGKDYDLYTPTKKLDIIARPIPETDSKFIKDLADNANYISVCRFIAVNIRMFLVEQYGNYLPSTLCGITGFDNIETADLMLTGEYNFSIKELDTIAKALNINIWDLINNNKII